MSGQSVTTTAIESTSHVSETRVTRIRSRVARRLLRNRSAVISLALIVLLILVAAFADVLAPQDPNAQDLARGLETPSSAHWLGTDIFGRDILSRLIVATRITLVASAQALGLALLLGVPAGLVAGYSGRLVDATMSRVSDALLAMPPLILALAIVGVLGPGLTNAMIAVGIVIAPRFFRLARAAGHSTRHESYIEACRASGIPTSRILWRHVLPNSSGPLLVQASFAIGLVITAEASLSFLGLGVQSPQSSWGSMIRQAFDQVHSSSWPIVPPTVAVVATIGAFFILGDGLRDALGYSAGDRA